MRLTLRTLLAYMDDVLEPEDREDLKAKIEHSEYAGDLLHRARDVMRRLRLGAPGIADLKKGMDVNSVAEYLDNTMSPEQVADFERLCLESDVALAEVASCHQILTMVLGEPADVRPEARARMYDIPAESDMMAMQSAQSDDGPPPPILPREEVPQVDVDTTPASHVPDYLRESFWERHRGKLVLAASLLIAGLVYLFWPPPEPDVPREIAQRGLEDQIQPPQVDEGDTVGETSETDEHAMSAAGAANGDTNGQSVEPTPEERPAGEPVEEEDVGPAREADEAEPIPPLPPELTGGTPDAAVDTLSAPGEGASTDQPELRLPGPADVRTPDGALPPEPPVPTVEPTEGAVQGSNAAADSATTAPVPSRDATAETVEANGETSATTAVVEPPEPQSPQVATYVSRGEMLLRQTDDIDWVRLAPLDQLFEGDQILALPASRPVVTVLGTNLSIQLQPATRVALDTGEMPNLGGTRAPAGLTVFYGHVVIFNSDQAGNWVGLQLRLGGAVYPVDLDGGSTLALEARRELPAGVDPLKNSGRFAADLFATTGRIRWQNENAVQSIEAPATWDVVDGAVGPVKVLSSEPSWINEDTIMPLDRLALRDVEPAIVPGRSARLSLAELADHRKREVRGLVSRASIHVGDFEPFVKSLNDASQSQLWDEHIAVLQGAMALDRQVAARVREAFVTYKGQAAGDDLFRLLWGYSKSQLENGGLEELIDYLNHESLDFRVLAFNNLHRATGKRLLYSPQEQQPQQRERYIREWRKRLMEGDLEVPPEGTGGPVRPG